MFFHSFFCCLAVLSAVVSATQVLPDDIVLVLDFWDSQADCNHRADQDSITTSSSDSPKSTALYVSANSVEPANEFSSNNSSLEWLPKQKLGKRKRGSLDESDESKDDSKDLDYAPEESESNDDSKGVLFGNGSDFRQRSSAKKNVASGRRAKKQKTDEYVQESSNHTRMVMPKPKQDGNFAVIENLSIPPFVIDCIIGGDDGQVGHSMEIIVDLQTQQPATDGTLHLSQESSSEDVEEVDMEGFGDALTDILNHNSSILDLFMKEIIETHVEDEDDDSDDGDDSISVDSMETFELEGDVIEAQSDHNSVDSSSSWDNASDEEDADDDEEEDADDEEDDMMISEPISISMEPSSSAYSACCGSAAKDSKLADVKKPMIWSRDKKNDFEKIRLDELYVAIHNMQSMFADYGHDVPEKSCFGYEVMLALAKILPAFAKLLIANENIILGDDQDNVIRRLSRAALPKIPKLATKHSRNFKKSYTSRLIHHLFKCLEGLLPFQKSRRGVRPTLHDKVTYIHKAAEFVFQLDAASRADDI